MSTAELKHKIAHYLTQIDDVSFLDAIKTIVESKVASGTYKLSDQQVKRVEEGRIQLKSGKTISDESVKDEIEKWLNTK